MTQPATATLLTVGHGTLAADGFLDLIRVAGVAVLVDVRSVPASRRHPHFARAALERSVVAAGLGYTWARDLGGFRRPSAASPNVALRHPAFRGYADWMAGERFQASMAEVAAQARRTPLAVMCSESLWWRCHRRLIADHVALLVAGLEPRHLLHDGSVTPHRLTEGARAADGHVVYDAGTTGALLAGADGGG